MTAFFTRTPCVVMTSVCFDTNILIDILGGNLRAMALVDECDDPVISKIVHMEVMVGCKYNPAVVAAKPTDYRATLLLIEEMTANWLGSTFRVLQIDNVTADFSVQVRKQTNAKLPDTVIHASAILNGLDLVTRNPSHFKPLSEIPHGHQNISVIVPY